MIAKEHSVKEWHLSFDVIPHQVFKIQAETIDQAKKLRRQIQLVLKELSARVPAEPAAS